MKKFIFFSLVLAILFGLVQACRPSPGLPGPSSPSPVSQEPSKVFNRDIILATTTSTQDSGLLDELIPVFEKKSGYRVKTIAVGSGQALAMGERGEADVLLVHSPVAEIKFMATRAGVNRRLVMHNDFVIVGPSADPAGIKGESSAGKAMEKIFRAKATFLSRGDESGTNTLEKLLWKNAGLDPSSMSWYQQSGQGMGSTLNIASEKGAYTISDRATFLAFLKVVNLQILVEGDSSLLNIYHIIQINPDRFQRVNSAGEKAFADFLVSPDAQAIIEKFGVDKFGQPLFFPDAGKPE